MNWLQFVVAALELPADPRERHFWGRLALLQLIYSLAGLLLGLACIIGGILLFFHGVTGSSSWVGEVIGAKGKLSDAAPGTVLFVVAALELPADPRERHFWGRLALLQLIYSLAGLLLGLACIIGGILLFFHGVAGSSSWVGEVIGLKSKLSDAAPGTVLFVVGLAVVWLTRFAVRVRQPIEIDLRERALASERREHSERRELAGRHRKAG